MVGGFNTNVRYRGRVFHIQTEDSGPTTARVVVTLVYEGGVILSSKKTRYEAGSGTERQQRVVRELMETQHAEVVRALKGGELDPEIGLRGGPVRPGGPAAGGAVSARASDPGEEAVDRFGQGVISDVSLDRVVLTYLGVR